jgi:hypothetical protein
MPTYRIVTNGSVFGVERLWFGFFWINTRRAFAFQYFADLEGAKRELEYQKQSHAHITGPWRVVA